MNKNIIIIKTSPFLFFCCGCVGVQAGDFGFQPRVETGIAFYEFKVDAISKQFSPTSNFTQEKLKFNDTMPLLSGGISAFYNKFFMDISVQRLFNGNDKDSSQLSSLSDTPSARVLTSNANYDADFDRNEYALSVGYTAADNFVIFGGYKWAKTKFNTKSNSPMSLTSLTDGMVFKGTLSTKLDYDFKYSGPFLGVTYGLPAKKGWFNGVFSFSSAVAFLDGKINVNKNTSSVVITEIDGNEIPPITLPPGDAQITFATKGDALGLAFGVGWRGTTPIHNLSYLLNMIGYVYGFDADNSDDPDITETTLMLRIGAAYAF